MKKSTFVFLILFLIGFSNETNAQDPFIGEIRMFGGTFAPSGWAECNGQLLPIASYTALFSIIGTTYGGDGQTTFALPDLRGRVPLGEGQGPGLTNRPLGQSLGSETNLLAIANLPAHSHDVNALSADGTSNNPNGNYPAGTKLLDPEYGSTPPNVIMNTNMIGDTGGNQAVNNMQPFQTVTFIIALVGTFPSQ